MNHPRSRLAYWITRFVNHKRALGFSYQGPEFVLRALCRHVERCGYSDLTAHGFDSWMATYQKHHPNTRSKWYSTVRYFCLYRRRREPDCFLPTADGVPKRQPHLLPVIVEPEQIARMLPLASNLLPNYQSPLRAPTTRLAIVLLYTCGFRLGELARLTLSDVEDDGRVLRIRDSKGHKSRLVPLSASATQELKAYLEQRGAVLAMASDAPLLCNREGGRFFHRYTPNGLRKVILYLFTEAGVRDEQGRRPRVHDLRHSFAVQVLLRWYRDGADVQVELPKLAIFMGHVSIHYTAYYLHWIPAVRELASRRFEQKFGHFVEGGIL
jgi:site-specific recombinase XerD